MRQAIGRKAAVIAASASLLLALGIGFRPVAAAYGADTAGDTHPASTATDGKGPIGWDAYRDLGELPLLPSGAQAAEEQYSSFDRTGGNNDFDHCLQQTAAGCVIAQRLGAGEIDDIWTTTNGGDITPDGTIEVILDGRTVIDAPFQDVVDGKLGAPFVAPLVANASQSSGGDVITVPMPFRDSMQVVVQNDPQYYHVTYRSFDDATGVKTFDPADKALDVIAKLKAAGTQDPIPTPSGAVTSSRTVTVAAGDASTVATTKGPGEISALRLRIPQLVDPSAAGVTSEQLATSDAILRNVRLTIAFDGTTTVDAPLGQFFGTRLGAYPVRSLMFAIDPTTQSLTAWWPMPYAQGAVVRLVNDSTTDLTGAQVDVTSVSSPVWSARLAEDGDAGYFHATTDDAPTVAGQDHTFLDTAGHGKFVGVTNTMIGPSNRGMLEGDERVYVDGSHTPQLQGTGTEDFFEGGWYFNQGTFTDPLNGESAHEPGTLGCPSTSDCTSAYRLMLGDSVPFDSSIDFGIEHGGVDDVAATYDSTAFWYGKTQPDLRWSDTLNPTEQASAQAHDYRDDGINATLTATYEGNDGTPQPVTRAVRAGTAPISFDMAVDPANDGVILARTSDQDEAYQEAVVTVDGQSVGTWAQPLGNTYHRWLDDEFQLPASVTAGHDRIAVTLTPVSLSAAWSAASYETLSLVAPFDDRQAPGAVTGLKAAGDTTNAINLTWRPAADNVYAPAYQVYASQQPTVAIDTAHLVTTTRLPSVTLTGLGLKQTWYYRVRAVDAAGNTGPLSSVASATSGSTLRLEAENLLPAVSASAPLSSQGDCCGVTWSNNAQLFFQGTAAGAGFTVDFDVPQAGTYDLSVVQTMAIDYGINTLTVDGRQVGGAFDAYHDPNVTITPPIDEGDVVLTSGENTLTLTVTGKNAASANYLAGLDYLELRLT